MFLITYKDSSGSITDRKISDVQVENLKCIQAFCHLRNQRRSFKIRQILQATDLTTGEIIDPFDLIPGSKNEEDVLNIETKKIIEAIKALIFFTFSTRGGLKDRELSYITKFIKEIIDISAFSDLAVKKWLKTIWCCDIRKYVEGDISEYNQILKSIPKNLLPKCNIYACLIAYGSGRKCVPQNWMDRIHSEFSQDPKVTIPWVNVYEEL